MTLQNISGGWLAGEDAIRRTVPEFDSFIGWGQVRSLQLDFNKPPTAGVPELSMQLQCEYLCKSGNFVITIKMEDVRRLSLPAELGGQYFEICELVIQRLDNSTDTGCMRYLVADETDGCFSCLCREFSFTDITAILPTA
jgi:hypothetical protein